MLHHRQVLLAPIATVAFAAATVALDAPYTGWCAKLTLLAGAITALLLLRSLALQRRQHLVAIDDIPNPIFIKDLAGKVIGINRAFEEATGLSRTDTVGKRTEDLSEPMEARAHRSADLDLMINGGVRTYKSTIHLPDGEERIFLYKKAALHRDARLVGVIGSFIDISGQEVDRKKLAVSEKAYQTIVETANEGIWIIDRAGDTTFVNARMAQMLGYTVEEFLGRSMFDFMDAAARKEAERNMQRRSDGIDEVHDFRFKHHDGSDRWFIIGTKSMNAEDGSFDGALGMLTDITARKSAEEELLRAQQALEEKVALRTAELEESNRRLIQRQRAIDAGSHGVMIATVAPGGVIIDYANPASEWLTGFSPQEAVGRTWQEMVRFESNSGEARKITAAIENGADDNAILEILHRDGSRGWCHLHVSAVHDADGVATHFVLASYDITSLRRYEERLEHLKNFDVLTGLPNAQTLYDRLLDAFDLANKLGHRVHLAVIEIDRSRTNNDNLGEHRSDQMLREVATRMASLKEATDLLARVGNNQFALIMPRGRDDVTSVTDLLSQVRRQVAVPFDLAGQIIRLSASIGVATYPDDGMFAEVIIERGNIALRHVKAINADSLAHYEASMGEAASARLEMDIALSKAVQHDDFFLQYQPQIDIATQRVVGHEALLRWECPELGRVSPALFIPLLESSGDIVMVGQQVLLKACRQAQAFNTSSGTRLHMSVNLSARQFGDPELVACVKSALTTTALPPQYLILEITESVLVQDSDRAISTMHALRELGVGLSIDDFGTGYSSLAYLKRFPVTELKIDQSFVRDITTDPGDALIVASVINLARSLGLKVVAEGVETREQLGFLTSQGCDLAQGYLFSRPLDPEAILLTQAALENALNL